MSVNTRGQANRSNNVKEVKGHFLRLCPGHPGRLINLVAGEMNMAPDTIRYSFLPILLAQGYLYYGKDDQLYCDPNRDTDNAKPQPNKDTRSEEEQAKDLSPEERENYERFRKSRKP
jgi:hypothetical protein